MHYVIGIDPDIHHHGFAVFDKFHNIVKIGYYNSNDINFWKKLFFNYVVDNNQPIVAIEEQFVSNFSKKMKNGRDVIKLIRAAHRMRVWLNDIFKINSISVYPVQWQSHIFRYYNIKFPRSDNISAYKKRKLKQQAYQNYACELLKIENSDLKNIYQLDKNLLIIPDEHQNSRISNSHMDDIISSICIGSYVLTTDFIGFDQL